MRTLSLFALSLSLLACRTKDVDVPLDLDADGWSVEYDCDDNDPSVHPNADEVCDGVDNDCDTFVDEHALDALTWYADVDADGYGDPDAGIEACEAPEGAVEVAGDCDDTDAAFHPGAVEDDCDDPNDYNCDGSVGETDADGDGWSACEDCDDADAAVSPGALEVCDGVDNDCDAVVDGPDALDASTWYADTDGDTWGDPEATVLACEPPDGAVAVAGDCDDTTAARSPDAEEVCDGVDNDCDGDTDEDDADDATVWYGDGDGDGFGGERSARACTAPEGFVAAMGDCDDGDASAHPGGTEVCDGADNDCDGTADVGAADAPTWYADSDGDLHGDASVTEASCAAPSGYVAEATDCDDTRSDVHTGAVEVCDTVDNDCDGTVDEDDAADAPAWYADVDTDGYGAGAAVRACTAPAGHVADGTDCDDGRADVSPGDPEVCDGVDNDCDGTTDEDDADDADPWYADGDGDGVGGAVVTTACAAPSGFVASTGDCDDGDASAHPGGTEVCDGADNDCDGTADVGAADAPTWYADVDGDLHGDASVTEASCAAPSGYVADATDCDDTRSDVHTGAVEVCDTVDNDCDGTVDEDDAADADVWYADGDGDAFGDAATTRRSCTDPGPGWVEDDADCDDGSAAVNPLAHEVCDGIDNDCTGAADEEVLGGFLTCPADSCADILSVWPGAPSGTYALDPVGGDAFFAWCDMTGGGWLDVVATFHLPTTDPATMTDRFFVSNNAYSVEASPGVGLSSGADGLVVVNDNDESYTHTEGFHLMPVFSIGEAAVAYRMQGADEGYRCNHGNWIPLSGPGYDGGCDCYASPCPAGYTCIQGRPTSERDAPISAAWSGALGATELLTWSGSGLITETVGNCARDADIPVSTPATFFTELRVR